MTNHWKEILPVDRYSVFCRGRIRSEDMNVVTLLYQPLIGAKAYSLYMTLMEELGSNESSHHSLMNYTQMNLQQIFEERKKLEAIGLMKTYQKTSDDDRVFLYELLPVMSPEEFFKDDISVYLYGRLGKDRYLEVKRRLCMKPVDTRDYHEITASFNEVFHSLHQSEMRAGLHPEVHQSDSTGSESEKIATSRSPQFTEEDFDFDLLVRNLSSFIIPSEVITSEIKDAIYRLAFIYEISPLDMSSIIQQAYFRDDVLTVKSLRNEVQRWYKIEKPGQLPTLSVRKQEDSPAPANTQSPQTPEEMMVHTFETISPKALLERHSEGGRAASADLKLIDTIMFDQNLPAGVVNVLIDYVLNTNDMKLIHSHVEKIASQWKRKKIKTVKDAMALAKAEHQKYQAYKNQKSNFNPKYSKYQRNEVRRDKLPKWMKDDHNHQPKEKKNQQSVSEMDEKWLEDYLKEL
ncbi:replication initiation and membrane attachment family protein [Pseudalkalibacillus sp. SCS-8]|uniref:replication initiation and membrane attachment family protein n=1 Tax=Pseudalkalibacillus nanhaiensis TaxID=3115291 RepID=UPI0032DB9B5B